MKKGESIELTIDSLAFGGEGVGKKDGLVVFVKGALPGQKICAQIARKKKSHAKARLLSVIEESPFQVAPSCSHFEDCGGCSLQHYAYEKQLEAKFLQVRETLMHIGRFENPPVELPCAAPAQIYYRNKMEYTFGVSRWLPQHEIDANDDVDDKDFGLGLHVSGRFNKILQIEACYLQSELSNDIRNYISAFAKKSTFRPYTTQDHSGFWRFLVIREGKNTNETLVMLVTQEAGASGTEEISQLSEQLRSAFPEITTVVHAINTKKAQVAVGEKFNTLFGPGHIYDKIGSCIYRISPASFFQTNTLGAEVLYQQIAALSELAGDEILYDLYCGAGTIGIYLSEMVKRVIGIEVIEDAVKDAKENATLNGRDNCHFLCGDLKEHMEQVHTIIHKHGAPDVIVLDPPRAGLHPDVIKHILALKTPKIIYVSCNPATFSRDVQLFHEGGYQLDICQPVDMFPHTAHIELVSRLTLLDNS